MVGRTLGVCKAAGQPLRGIVRQNFTNQRSVTATTVPSGALGAISTEPATLRNSLYTQAFGCARSVVGAGKIQAVQRRCVCSSSSGVEGSSREDRGALLVLGGNGYVGGEIVKVAARGGYDIISISRRGAPSPAAGSSQAGGSREIIWEKGDLVKDSSVVGRVLDNARARGQRVVGMVHAVGMLLESDANAMASGSGSVPEQGTTYDMLTRETALNAAAAWVEANKEEAAPLPFVFVSAAEAGWTESLGGDPFFTPDFLRRYLRAKRAVEKALIDYGSQGALRPIILRPSLVFSPDRLPSLPAVGAFFIGNTIGLPGIDRPVLVSTLAAAAVSAIQDASISGIQAFGEMEELAARSGAMK